MTTPEVRYSRPPRRDAGSARADRRAAQSGGDRPSSLLIDENPCVAVHASSLAAYRDRRVINHVMLALGVSALLLPDRLRAEGTAALAPTLEFCRARPHGNQRTVLTVSDALYVGIDEMPPPFARSARCSADLVETAQYVARRSEDLARQRFGARAGEVTAVRGQP